MQTIQIDQIYGAPGGRSNSGRVSGVGEGPRFHVPGGTDSEDVACNPQRDLRITDAREIYLGPDGELRFIPDFQVIHSPLAAVPRSDSLQMSASGTLEPIHLERPYSSSTAPAPSSFSSTPRIPTSSDPIHDFMVLWENRASLASRDRFAEQGSRYEDFEDRMALCLENIIASWETRHAALRLKRENTQAFLDAVQHVLKRGTLPNAAYANIACKLMQRISEAHDQLPMSLFISGVHDPDQYPTFSGGFADVYRASYNGKRVALKRIRTFTSELTNPRRMKFCREALVWQGLRHPFLIPFLGIDRHSFPSSFCMVSPWMKHGTILKFLADQ